MRYILTLIFLSLTLTSFSQQHEILPDEDVEFPIDTDTLTTEPEPVGGYQALFRHFETVINKGDTIGKKFPIHLYPINIRVNKKGDVDSAYIGVNHAACALHRRLTIEIQKAKWIPAKKRGIPVTSEFQLQGSLWFNKVVLKKEKCR